jgi:chemotaxis protein histidine kinase CheA
LGEVLVVVRDVTSAVKRGRAEQAQREAMNVFRRILDDRAGFREFFRGTCRLLDGLEEVDVSRVMRNIHTLKGNTSLYGIGSVAEICHTIESRIHEEGGGPTAEEIARIRAAWVHVREVADELEAASGAERIEVSSEEHEAYIAQLESRRIDEDLIVPVRNWANEPASRRLQRVAEQGRSIARRLGKGETVVETRVTPKGLRLSPAHWAPFWAIFSHVLRNTFDHGVEPAAERAAANKPPHGKVEISLTASRGGVELCIADDGRGIGWERIAERAEKLGLPHATASELEEALYADKVSTLAKASETSGRGVGMGAVRDAVRACGGSVSIETSAGRGTAFRFRFPPAMLGSPRRSPSRAPKVA